MPDESDKRLSPTPLYAHFESSDSVLPATAESAHRELTGPTHIDVAIRPTHLTARSVQVAEALDQGRSSTAEGKDDHGDPSSRGFDLLRQPVTADEPGDEDRRDPDP